MHAYRKLSTCIVQTWTSQIQHHASRDTRLATHRTNKLPTSSSFGFGCAGRCSPSCGQHNQIVGRREIHRLRWQLWTRSVAQRPILSTSLDRWPMASRVDAWRMAILGSHLISDSSPRECFLILSIPDPQSSPRLPFRKSSFPKENIQSANT